MAIADFEKIPEDANEQFNEWQDKTPLGKALQDRIPNPWLA